MKVDYGSDAVTRRLFKTSELGRLCRSLRRSGSVKGHMPGTPLHLLRGLTLVQYLASHQSETTAAQETPIPESPKETHARN